MRVDGDTSGRVHSRTPRSHNVWFIYLLGWSGSKPTVTEATYWPIAPALDGKWWLWSNRWKEWLAREAEVLGGNLPPVPICPPQFPHDLTRFRTWATIVGNRRLTTHHISSEWRSNFSRCQSLILSLRSVGCLPISSGIVCILGGVRTENAKQEKYAAAKTCR
jgi:hypothetical protein